MCGCNHATLSVIGNSNAGISGWPWDMWLNNAAIKTFTNNVKQQQQQQSRTAQDIQTIQSGGTNLPQNEQNTLALALVPQAAQAAQNAAQLAAEQQAAADASASWFNNPSFIPGVSNGLALGGGAALLGGGLLIYLLTK